MQMNRIMMISLYLLNIIFLIIILVGFKIVEDDIIIEYANKQKELKILKKIIEIHSEEFFDDIILVHTNRYYEEGIVKVHEKNIKFFPYSVELSSNSIKIINWNKYEEYNIIKYLVNNKNIGIMVVNDETQFLGYFYGEKL